jgi:hypothetical protein
MKSFPIKFLIALMLFAVLSSLQASNQDHRYESGGFCSENYEHDCNPL